MRALSGTRAAPSPSFPALGADEFAALAATFAPFGEKYRFAIAVSGGPDSMALAFCLHRWSRERGFISRALIVDHGLRPESAVEAETVRQRLTALGLDAEILRWEHDAVVTRLHTTARKARYRLLADACKRHSISDLWLAHQMEDQAETIVMRLAKGSGIDGLAGMSGASTFDGVRLLRPFLGVPKARLIATCDTAGLAYVEDASNRSEKFARGRLRRILPFLAEEGLTLERLIDLGARASEAKEALEHYTQELLHRSASRDEAGAARLALDALREAPRAIAARALARALQAVHVEDYAPEHGSLMTLLDALRAGGEMPARTLHGCLISKTPVQATILRETSHITDAPLIRPGESVLWDGRWQVTLAKEAVDSYTIKPLGSPSHETLDALAPGLRKRVPQGRVRAGLPALWQGEKLMLIPSLTGEGVAQVRLVSAGLTD
jgi:tRNA(Ile)-lysidine synthase